MVAKFQDIRRRYPSSRSVVMGNKGMVATSQPLAALAGIRMLLRGGNAIDAAVATSAALNVVEPMSTGIGGDAFALVYITEDRRVRALNASGRSPYAANLEYFAKKGLKNIPDRGMLSVTVPGTVDGWATLLGAYGTMSLSQALEPAIIYAKEGFPVTEIIGRAWRRSKPLLAAHPSSAKTYLTEGRAPRIGDIFKQPDLARTLRQIGEQGRDAFYQGDISKAIVEFSQRNGGLLSLKDLAEHTSTWVEPISINYRGYNIYECPPNGQGLTVLLGLNMAESFDSASIEHNSAEYLHLLIEIMKLAFADAFKYIADPDFIDIPLKKLLSNEYAERQLLRINYENAAEGIPIQAHPTLGDTAYLTVVDEQRNAVSFINSLYMKFGSGMTVDGTGICLQNRGALFSLDPEHVNRLEPHKRPYHTIIPAMVLKGDKLLMSFGVMGGLMQPQGHLQVLANILDFDMDVQSALDAPRFRYMYGRLTALESTIDESVRSGLKKKGHDIQVSDVADDFGGGQIIMIDPISGALLGGSDPRKDGCAIGF